MHTSHALARADRAQPPAALLAAPQLEHAEGSAARAVSFAHADAHANARLPAPGASAALTSTPSVHPATFTFAAPTVVAPASIALAAVEASASSAKSLAPPGAQGDAGARETRTIHADASSSSTAANQDFGPSSTLLPVTSRVHPAGSQPHLSNSVSSTQTLSGGRSAPAGPPAAAASTRPADSAAAAAAAATSSARPSGLSSPLPSHPHASTVGAGHDHGHAASSAAAAGPVGRPLGAAPAASSSAAAAAASALADPNARLLAALRSAKSAASSSRQQADQHAAAAAAEPVSKFDSIAHCLVLDAAAFPADSADAQQFAAALSLGNDLEGLKTHVPGRWLSGGVRPPST